MRFARGFLRNFTIILVAYLGYTKWNNDETVLAIALFLLALVIGFINYRLLQKEKMNEDDTTL